MNGSQTSCEAALIDSSAAFIAASCLQYKDGKLDDSAKYELMVKMGDNSAGSQLYPITTISVHPKFDSSIFINNLAVVQYNKGAAIAWNYNIGINPSEWNTNYFARRSLKNLGTKEWNNISALESIVKPADCSKYSKVYGSNSKDFICNAGDISSIYNNACAVPYGTVYSVVQPNNINIAAIHSHSVVVDGSLCSGQQKLHYYTLLRNYAAWAAKEINRSIGGFVASPDFTMKANYTYSMKSNTGTVNGVQVFAGNRYIKDPVDPALAQPPSSPSPTSKSTTTSTTTSTTSSTTNSTSTKATSSTTTSTTHSTTNTHDTPTLPSDSDSDSDDSSSGSSDDSQESNTSPKSGGISTTVIAIIAIVLIILIGVGVWFYMRRKKRIQLQQQLEEADKWDDKDDQNLPAAMRMTNDFGYQNNLPPLTNNYAHDFGDRRADSPAVPPQKGGGSHLNNPYRESEYAPESRPNYGGQRPDTHYTTDNRYSEYTDAIGQQGYGNNYNAGYRR
ncbi:hypothetical protein H4S07_002911 [Coemansia furcata]|uniref:Uncharacterized protein n=1 Tax=Coemansia furcata TaxID=417177 RepID=A0ACC1LJL9_9FUNG|nr:hypothetical protein H4S07_002911 [Coemansia furcata]